MRIWYQSFIDEENGADYWRFLRTHLSEMAMPGTEFDIHGITPFDSYAHQIVEMRCAREVVCNAVRAEKAGYDAFVIGHFQDTGLHEARSVVDIPVVSLGEATMLHAMTLGLSTALVSINKRFIPWHLHQIKRLGFEARVTGVHAMEFEPGQILAAFGKPAKIDEARKRFDEQAIPLVEAGAEVLIPAGGLPMLLFSGIAGHRVGGVPVVNGIPIVLAAAETAVRLRQKTGLEVSRAGDYVKAPPEVIEEFITHPKGL